MVRRTTIASLAIAISSSAVVAYDACYTQAAPNLLVNPSWEDGTAGWTYITPGGAPSITNAQYSDGEKSLLLPSSAAYSLIQQTIRNLAVGTAYDVSIDLRGVVSSSYSITEQCTMYLYHDALTTTNLIDYKITQFNRNLNSMWVTLGGKYTATKDNILLGFYATCTPYRTPVVFNLYVDNVIGLPQLFVPNLLLSLLLSPLPR
ncbi:hypothetical protein NUW58_g4491 [Xylaria curta]|uniref:Uncharacterized protein n=1 Tax=Xylaria curta TaxID=42375 RepID=A0ACC1P8P1_9PEZI|nr:hypothetical protein NUW58_g4491 [Xylaria curta]